MPLGHVLYESGDEMRRVYFPTTSIVSLLYVVKNGSSADLAIVQSAGQAFRVAGRILEEEFGRARPVQHVLLRYTQALVTQMSQTAVCNRHHSVEQQLSRWLLMSLDRLATNELTMTQELIANMLGVRREGVTEFAGKLQKLGLIEYARGHTYGGVCWRRYSLRFMVM